MTTYSQVQPITDLDQYGIIYDRPAASLPPNAFSDALNVRFRDGTVRKMMGEVNIFPNVFDDPNNQIGGIDANYDGSIVKYSFFWPNPNLIGGNSGYYILITEETRLVADDTVPGPGNVDPVHQRDVVYLVSIDGTQKVEKGVFSFTTIGQWHHTFFQGGFAVVINNTLDAPQYILDLEDNTDINTVPVFKQLPGWESYNVNEIILQDTFDANEDSYIFDLGQNVDFDNFEVVVERIRANAPTTVVTLTAEGDLDTDGTPNNPSWTPPAFSTLSTTPWTTEDEYQIFLDSTTNTTVLNFPDNLSTGTAKDTVTVTIRSRNAVTCRAGVIRAFGDFLIAGNLTERDENDENIIIRSLPGVIRTSDVAKPGAIPNNWNPFAAGVSTADEYVISDTSPVQDMAIMQGNMYVYSSDSVSAVRLTGSASVPISVTPVADNLGCQTREGVVEFEGKHFVIGSRDVYLFGGNPGSTESVANDRVRRYLFNNLNPSFNQTLFAFDNTQQDEIWVCFPDKESADGTCNQALIWSYRNNTWTRRELRGVVAGNLGLIPGGGLPQSVLTFSGTSGSNGVSNVGAYEVRVMGTDTDISYNDSDNLMYPYGGDELIYDTGRLAAFVRTGGGMYSDSEIFPVITLSGPDGVSDVVSLSTVGTRTATDIWGELQTSLEAKDGWTFSTLPTGYTQETGTVRLIASEDGGSFLGLRDVDPATPFTGSMNSNNKLWKFNFKESTVESDIHGVTVINGAGGNDYRGSFVKRSTPTILAIRLNAPLETGGEKMIFLQAGTSLDYDPATHTGATNGTTLTASQAVASWISTINLYSTTLIAAEGSSSEQMTLSPTSVSENSEIVLDARVNDTAENAQWIWDRFQETELGTIAKESWGTDPFTNSVAFDLPETEAIEVQSVAPAIAGTLDTQYAPDGARTPNRTTTVDTVTPDMDVVSSGDLLYDVDRPWAKSQINPNLSFPVLTSRQRIPGPQAGELVYMGKIIAADVGWSIPTWEYTPRVVTADLPNFSEIVTNNDAPLSYTSFFEKVQGNVIPNMDTETIHEVSLWASGYYQPYINSTGFTFNRLQLRAKGTNNPGQVVDLTTIGEGVTKNTFFISESNKMDTRLHGRYTSYRITDEILDSDSVEQDTTSNTKRTTSTAYSKMSLWEVSGIQPEINKGGRR